MGFWKNIKHIITNITFKGRATRKEMIHYTIFNFIYGFVTAIFCFVPISIAIGKSVFQTGTINASNISTGLVIYSLIAIFIAAVFGIWLFIAGIALYVRRFHDLNYSGWAYFIYYIISVIICFGPKEYQMICSSISYIMGLALIIFLMAVKGTAGVNNYGEPGISKEKINQPNQTF